MRDQPLLDTIEGYLRTELFPQSDLLSQRVFLNLYRLLSEGSPVTRERISDALGIDNDFVKGVLDSVASSRFHYDEAGGIIAFAGLSLVPTPHRFEYGGQELFTWCAFDALFLPELLEGPARVSSLCPVTHAEIRLTVTPDGLEDVEPSGAVMTFVMPESGSHCADLRGAFCNHVNFLASRQASGAWLKRNVGAAVLSLGDAFELGHIRNVSGFKDVLAGNSRGNDAEPILPRLNGAMQ